MTAANSLVQQRVSNTANEITAVGATVGAVWQTPAYDRNGNMTTIPQPASPTSGFAGVFDAWNRLVALSGVATYGYDGLHRRTYSLVSGVYRFFYYSDQWQVLEEYLSTSLIAPDRQYVWGLRYIDELVMRDRGLTGTLERFYALQDANWNVVAICDASGTVQERYAYTAYGVCAFLNASGFAPISGSAYDWTVLYTGRVLDHESGLYYYRARYYAAGFGMFVGRDPIGFDAGGMNFYCYAHGKPVDGTDPSGNRPRRKCGVPTNWFAIIPDRWHFAPVLKDGSYIAIQVSFPFRVLTQFRDEVTAESRYCPECCSFRQYVKGVMQMNGKDVSLPMPYGKKLDANTFNMDGAPDPVNPREWHIPGNRSDTRWSAHGYYCPGPVLDWAKGRIFRYTDSPLLKVPPGQSVKIELTFRFVVHDTCDHVNLWKEVASKEWVMPALNYVAPATWPPQ